MNKIFILTIASMISLFFWAGESWSADFCVSNATDLQAALNTASFNGEDNTIKVVQGTYSGNFVYYSSEGHNITLEGGYIAGCGSRVVDPSNTILDGGNTKTVLDIHTSDGGNILVDGFTIQNGNSIYDGGGVNAYSDANSGTAGDITLTNNIIKGNTASNGRGGGVFAVSDLNTGNAGHISIMNNTITENTGSDEAGGIFVKSRSSSGTAGNILFINNTITGNQAPYAGGVEFYMVSNSLSVYNNIIWGNTATTNRGDIDLSGTGTAFGFNNDYHDLSGSWNGGFGGNIDADPLFVGSGDYHLRPASPCIDKGLNSAPGIPATDLEGYSRIIDGNNDGTATVDMGAYEYGKCVSTAAELQSALTNAQSNGVNDTILVVQGTYNGHFTFNSSEGHSITLEGGYTAGCANRVVDPANTILDGNQTGRVLSLYNNGGNITVDGFTIRNGNIAALGSGVLVMTDTAGDITFTDNIITGNTGSGAGGVYAYSIEAGNITFTGNTITGNNASSNDGGGILALSYSDTGTVGAITLSKNVITGNTSVGHNGGGVYAQASTSSGTAGDITLLNNTITGNHASGSGGVLATSSSTSSTAGAVTLLNNTITGNSASDIGGVAAQSHSSSGTAGTVTLINNTITGNSATNSGGGAYIYIYGGAGGGTGNCYNNIIWGNSVATGGDIYLQSGSGTINGFNNDYTYLYGTWDNPDTSSNINADPLFVGSGDYHLQPTSPCIDAGNNSAPDLPATDFEGDNRVVDGDHRDIARVDIGADEYTGLIIPVNQTICAACTLINKYQPPFQWSLNGTFKTFTIYFSTSSTDFSGKGYFITKANIQGTKNSYTPSLGTWQKIMKSSNNSGSIRDIYWKVVGTRGDKGKTTWSSEARHFQIDGPLAAEILSPADEAKLSSGTFPTFIFSANCNIKLQLEISSVEDFSDSKKIKKFTYSVKDPNITASLTKTLSSGQWKGITKLIGVPGTGYFRVKAWDGIKRETTSGVKSFTVIP